MKYRVWTNGKFFKIQRKRILFWVWLDACWSWNNRYGKQHPKYFKDFDSMLEFIGCENWVLMTSDNIDALRKG